MGGGQSAPAQGRNRGDYDPDYDYGNDAEEAKYQQQQQQGSNSNQAQGYDNSMSQQYQQQQQSLNTNQARSYENSMRNQQQQQSSMYQGNRSQDNFQMNANTYDVNSNNSVINKYGQGGMNYQGNRASNQNYSYGNGPKSNMKAAFAEEEEDEEEEKGPDGQRLYLMSNNPSQIRTSELPEDLPKAPRFVKTIPSAIPYPTDPSHFVRQKLFEKYEFTENTNIFYVNEEEKKAIVHRSETMKPPMVLREVTNGEWTDDGLPASVESIIKDRSKHSFFKHVTWKKLSEIAPIEGFQIVADCNLPTAVKPGLLNNKALQSALSILAESEANIPSLFSEFNESSPSIFAIWLNNTNEWRVYMLDEFFPYDMETEGWAFITSGTETWALILEKALAKMYGSYFALQRGHPAHFIYDIMGAPYRHFYYDNPVECWNFLNSIDRSTTTIVAMNKDPRFRITSENDIFKEPSYSYAILDLQEVKTARGVERLVKLRNPWDEDKWTGDWSENSNRWTQHLLKKLNPDGIKDGIFWMNIIDFVKYYGLGFTFQVFPDYFHCSLRLKHSFKRNYSLMLMNIQEAGKLFVTISQRDHKHFVNYEEKYTYSLVRLMIVEVDAKLQFRRFVTGLYDKARDCDLQANFTPGDYLIYLEVDWEQSMNREIVISTYGETTSVFYELNSLEDKLDLLKKFFAVYYRSRPTTDVMIDYGHLGDKRIRRYVDYVFGYLCFYYLNSSDLFRLVEKVKMESLFGLEITPPYSDSSEFDVTVPENSDFMVLYKTTLEGQMMHHSKHTSWSYLFPNVSEEMIKKLILSKAKKVLKRKLMGREVDIIVYVYAFNGGFCFYYVNKTEFTYRERLGLDLFNLISATEDEHNQQTYFKIVLGPGQEFLMQFRVKNPTLPFSYVSRVSYKIHITPKETGGYQSQDDGYGYDEVDEGQSEYNGEQGEGSGNNQYINNYGNEGFYPPDQNNGYEEYDENQGYDQYNDMNSMARNQSQLQNNNNQQQSVSNSFGQYIRGYANPQQSVGNNYNQQQQQQQNQY